MHNKTLLFLYCEFVTMLVNGTSTVNVKVK